MKVLRHFFSRKDFTHKRKHKKHKTQISDFHSDVFYTRKKYKKYKTQTSDFHSDVFYGHTKHKKHKNHKKHKTSNKRLFLRRCFYAYKNTVFCAHKKHKNANKRISDFLLLRCFLSA